ncbi:hypothetical protein CVT25_007360 [Psilocybe cyanescens]|uniref:Uncharacterized protein n=1 Tax=Psilocybe cyanescens TaxID=93625 RepID=A0A409XJG0_PSICY|nr:hypothetical protein CVT25_007360 [Psilocybe cyanescens]
MLFESTAFVALLASLASANSSRIWSTTDRVITTSQWSTTDRVITTSQWSTTDRVITTSETTKVVLVVTGNYTTVCFTTLGINTTFVPVGGNFTTYTTHSWNATKTGTTKLILPTNATTTDGASNAFAKQGTVVGANLRSSSSSDVPSVSQSSAAQRGDVNAQGFPMVALGLSLICGIGAAALSLS